MHGAFFMAIENLVGTGCFHAGCYYSTQNLFRKFCLAEKNKILKRHIGFDTISVEVDANLYYTALVQMQCPKTKAAIQKN